MSYSSKEQQKPKQNDDNSTYQLAFLCLCVVAMAVGNKTPQLQWLYFRYFEGIHLAGYSILVMLMGVAIWKIKKNTKPWAERIGLLTQAWKRPGAILAGTTEDGMALHLSERDRTGHVQIIGSTGRGKTESVIVPWLGRDIIARRNAILIDGKGDPNLARAVKAIAEKQWHEPNVMVFDLGNPAESCTINPLEYGSAQQITDRIFTAFNFDDTYYTAVQFDITSNVVQLIQEVDATEKPARPGVVTFRRLFELLSDDEPLKEAYTRSKNEPLKARLTRWLYEPRQRREEDLSGILSQLAPFAIGEVAKLVNGPREGAPHASISQVLLADKKGRSQIFVLLIPTLLYQEIGHQLGKLLLQEVGWAVGERASRSSFDAPFTPVYLDEFSAFVYPRFANTLNKARSSQVAFHLSHQSMGDLGVVSPDFSTIVTTNTNVKCVLGLNDPETADWMARHLGTATQEKVTEKAEESSFLTRRRKTGDISIREVEAYKIHPNRLKNYMNGRGVLHLPTPLGNITEEIQFARLVITDKGREYENG